MGLAHPVSGLPRPAGLLGLHPAQAQRDADLPEDEGEGKGSKAPLTESFLRYPNNKYVLLALLGATAGQGVVWYTGQFYALFFLTLTLKLDYISTYALIGLSLLIGTPFFIFFGWLSDRVGRLKIILAGCLIAAVTYFPLFAGLTHYVNPDLERFSANHPTDRHRHPKTCQAIAPWNIPTPCDSARDFLTKAGLSVHHCSRARWVGTDLDPQDSHWQQNNRRLQCAELDGRVDWSRLSRKGRLG